MNKISTNEGYIMLKPGSRGRINIAKANEAQSRDEATKMSKLSEQMKTNAKTMGSKIMYYAGGGEYGAKQNERLKQRQPEIDRIKKERMLK